MVDTPPTGPGRPALGRGYLLLLLVTVAYFVGRPGWNQNSRLALARALVEHGQVTIDPYARTTGDRALRNGHRYSDKAPGASFVGAGAVWLFNRVTALAGAPKPEMTVRDPLGRIAPEDVADFGNLPPGYTASFSATFRAQLYVFSLAAAGIPTVLSALFLARLLAAWGTPPTTARWTAVAYVVATPALPYGANAYGHALAAAGLAGGAALLLTPRAPDPRQAFAGGFCLGMAGCAEYPAAPCALGLWAVTFLRFGPSPALWAAAGGLPWVAALAAYHTAAFGHPLRTGYDFVELPRFAEGMQQRYGIGPPRPGVIVELLAGSYRGLLVASPVLVLSVAGLAGTLRRREARLPVAVATAIFTYFLLLNAGYYMWDGGAAAVGRHMLPSLPFLVLGLSWAMPRYPFATKALALVSVVFATALATAGPEAPRYGSAVFDHALPKLWRTEAAPGAPAGNLGVVMGLPGPASLLPLVLLWWAALRGSPREAGRADAVPTTASPGRPAAPAPPP